jgi:hypothetical protein
MDTVPSLSDADNHVSKVCTRCGELKLLSQFYRNRKSPDGRGWHCRSCLDQARDLRRKGLIAKSTGLRFFKHCSSCDLWKPRSDFYRPKGGSLQFWCKLCARQRSNAFYHKNKASVSRRESAKRRALRLEMIAAYGGVCVCCGESRWEFLTIDHVNGGGKKHQRSAGGSRRILEGLKKAGWPRDGFRLLCYDCNCSRGAHGYCPHESVPMVVVEESPKRPSPLKRCPQCQEWKRKDTNFFNHPSGASPYCKPCSASVRRQRRAMTRAGAILLDSPCGLGILTRCPKCGLHQETATGFHRNASTRTGYQCWCKACCHEKWEMSKPTIRSNSRKLHRKRRNAVLDAYGGKCQCCGDVVREFLTIDHIGGGGTRARLERRDNDIYRVVLKEGCPTDRYRLLCFNCNCSIGALGYCPHRK